MATTRYGVINHGHGIPNYIQFTSAAERQAFKEKFDAYHASHDHDGDIPTFENSTSVEYNKHASSHKADDVTIDGYSAYEILKYHEARENSWSVRHYQPPTCCVPPLIALDNQLTNLVAADTFERHELSTAFQDMPDDEFLSLIESIATKGVVDNIIKIYEGQILDGWHRYRAAQELGILRKLRFQVWDIQKDGDPLDYVIAKNLDRRRHTASQVAQILLELAERYGHGGDRSKGSSRDLETLEALAKKGNVSVSTMKRASAVQNLGNPEEVQAVKAGKVAATKVLTEAKQRKDNCKKALVAIMRKKGTLLDIDSAALAKEHQIRPADALKLLGQVQFNENKKARLRWQDAYTAVRTNYMNYEALSKNVNWEDFTADVISKVSCSNLCADTFTDADNRVKDCEDYLLLQDEAYDLRSLSRSIRNAADRPALDSFVNALIPDDVREAAQIVKHWERIDARLPQWKERLPVDGPEDVPVDKFTKDLLITVFREGAAERHKNQTFMTFEIGELGTPLSLREVDELCCHIQNETYWLIHAVRKALLGKGSEKLPLQEVLDDAKEKGIGNAKIEHAKAVSAVQTAFLGTELPALMTDFDENDTEGKLNKFFGAVVDHCFPKLRLNIFELPNEFLSDDDRRDLTLDEIQSEISILHSIVKEIDWTLKDKGRIPRWMDKVVEAITPLTEAELWEKINPAISEWKSARKGTGVSYASKTMFLSATKRFHDLPHDNVTDVDLLKKLLQLLTSENPVEAFDDLIKQQCDGKDIWKISESDESIDTLLDQIEDELPKWKERNANVIGNLSDVKQEHLLAAYRYCYGDRDKQGFATETELAGILQGLVEGYKPLILGAHQQVKISQDNDIRKMLSDHYQTHQTFDNLDIETLAAENNRTAFEIQVFIEQVKKDPLIEKHRSTINAFVTDGPENTIKVCLELSYPKANGFSREVFCSELFEVPRALAFPEDATERNQAFAEALNLLKSLLIPSEEKETDETDETEEND